MAVTSIPQRINCGLCELGLADPYNVWFLKSLFLFDDVQKYYVLREDHAKDIESFCFYVLEANKEGKSLNYIIHNRFDEAVGFISAEVLLDDETQTPIWNVGYAVHPNHRRQGIASAALDGFTDFLLQSFTIPMVSLDISEDNVSSQRVAGRCGFNIDNQAMGFYDRAHPELGIRRRWLKRQLGNRLKLFYQAVQYYRQKGYEEAIALFEQALEAPYIPGSPYTDAQIYSNMGMALSSLRRYEEAFHALKRAQRLGLNNPSIEKELKWLRDHAGLY